MTRSSVPLVMGINANRDLESIQRCVNGVLRYCENEGNCTVRDFRLTEVIEYLEKVRPAWQGRADGVIIGIGPNPTYSTEQLVNWVLQAGVPVVSIASDWLHPKIPACFLDAKSLGMLAASHLMSIECKSFLYVGYDMATGSHLRAREFKTALARRRKPVTIHQSEAGLHGSFSDKDVLMKDEPLIHVLKTLSKPIGLWALNDNYARAAALLCEEIGLNVPGEVRVMGVDDLAISRTSHPMLTTIRTAREEVGYEAARILHQLMLKKRISKLHTEISSSELIVRVSTSGRRQSGNFRDAFDYLQRHACDALSVNELIKITGVSRRSFERWFQKQVGRSPGEEINQIRIDRAKELLSQSDLSIAQIASMVGFKGPTSFSTFFRKVSTLTPREYRKSHRPD